jgi:hypothetical protein
MNERPDPTPASRNLPDAPSPRAPAPGIRAVAAPLPRRLHGPQPLSDDTLHMTTAMREAGLEVPVLVARFPHVLNGLSPAWDKPAAALKALGELMVDRRGDRRGYPEDALAELLALRRTLVTRIVDVEGP